MRQKVDEYVNLEQMADALAYMKGEVVLGMIEKWIGPETFRKGVLAYLSDHEWKNARGADLWNALSKASGQDLNGLMASYLDQPGVPTVTAEIVDGTSVKLSQQRYVSFGETDSPELWTIPVTMRFSDG